jgi:serine/threonine protein kinase
MGIVFRARQRTPDRIVALKIIRPDHLAARHGGRDKAVERFRAEAQAAARLEHEGILPVYEVGEVDGQPFFTMRFVEGRGLDDVLRDGPLAGRDAAGLLEPVARAVQYAHDHDVVHRDIKPRNILLDTNGRPYVADFGLAKSLAAVQELTETKEVLGTPAYMSPEQARGAAGVDRRTDVYSLGATLYELLTGRPPFRAATPLETQRQVVENEPVPPRQLNPAVARDLETVCLKCLQKDPDARYGSAEELAAELGRFLRGEATRARPLSVVGRGAKWCRRNPWMATALSLLLAVAIAAPVAALIQRNLAARNGELAS